MIRELRVLPPLVIARFGAAPTPMDNYDVVIDPERPLGYRTLRPAETLEVDEDTGGIVRTFVPERLAFTENGLVRPVAPFLEVWALTDDNQLQPLTTDLLADDGASVEDLRWRVQVANFKVFRRTGDAADKVEADTGDITDHARHPLDGTCTNFWPGKTIPFGSVRFIRPTASHPQIRLRFTPAPGFVYGADTTEPGSGPPADGNLRDVVYDASPGRGNWVGYIDGSSERPVPTAPGGIYAQDRINNPGVSLGYLDDACDGVVRVTLTLGGRSLSAFGRVGAGPPTYVPDGLPVRTVADELEQALFGPTVRPEEATIERVEEIVRRAFETVRLMHTPTMNGQRNTATMVVSGMAAHDASLGRRDPRLRRRLEPIMARALVDSQALQELHQSLLVALRSGAAPWFADVLRDYDQVGDLTDRGRRRMPAMMRGADGRHLALTRRQIALIRTLVRGPVFPNPEDDGGTP